MSSSLSNIIYDKLLEDILSNRIQPGEFINRRDIAEKMNVSVAPVLEAMILLENDGLLETMPRKGTRVCLVKNEDISGYLVIREALECTVVRMICGQTIADAMDDLIPLAEEVDAAPLRSLLYFRKDHEFHTELVKLCKSEVLNKEYERIAKRGLFYNTNKLIHPGDVATGQSHSILLEQLKTATPDEAYHIMRAHIISGKGSLIISK